MLSTTNTLRRSAPRKAKNKPIVSPQPEQVPVKKKQRTSTKSSKKHKSHKTLSAVKAQLDRARRRASYKRKKHNKVETVHDDGFIIDDDTEIDVGVGVPTSSSVKGMGEMFPRNQPYHYNALEIWRTYQTKESEEYTGADDGFIPDDGFLPTENRVNSVSVHTPAATVNHLVVDEKRKKSSKKKKSSHGSKKLSKKKRRKAERKWLKKMFDESVIIAEPQDTESSISPPHTASSTYNTTHKVDDGYFPHLTTPTEPIPADPLKMFVKHEEHCSDAWKNKLSTSHSTNDSTSSVGLVSVKNDYVTSDMNVFDNVTPTAVWTTAHPYVHKPVRSDVHQESAMPILMKDINKDESWRNGHQNGNKGFDKKEIEPTDDGNEFGMQMEKERHLSGMSKMDWGKHLLRLHADFCKPSVDAPKIPKQNDMNVTANASLIPSPLRPVTKELMKLHPSKRGEDKKRYKMELQVPAKTTVIVTNLVDRLDLCPKVYFMLKKSSTQNGEQQEPSSMNGGKKTDPVKSKSTFVNKSPVEATLSSELCEITKRFLQSQSGSVSTSVGDPLSVVPKALEFSIE